MRTTITIPDETFAQVRQVAKENHQSVSSLIAGFTIKGLAQRGNLFRLETDPVTGLPAISIGRTITTEEVVEAIAE